MRGRGFTRGRSFKAFLILFTGGCALTVFLLSSYVLQGDIGTGQPAFVRPSGGSGETSSTPSPSRISGLASDADAPLPPRQYYDLVVAILIKGPGTPEGAAEMERMRHLYARYGGALCLGSDVGMPAGSKAPDWTFRYVLVVDGASSGVGPVPPNGVVAGDMYHVDAPGGFEHISDKTLALMSLAAHFDFRFLAKTDSDTFPCLRRLAAVVENAAPPAEQPRLYAGLLTKCGDVVAKGELMHDARYAKATGGVLKCHPMYHQGAFYLLGRGLVDHLYRSRHDLQVIFNEDAMVGLWLLGVRRTVVDIGGAFNCRCQGRPPVVRLAALPLPFYHSCKLPGQIEACEDRLGLC
ncbi:unnamed protein product [Phaeothamnion confervicola]